MQLPIDPKNPQWAMVMADYDVVTRAHLNALFAACPAGVGFTVIADSSASHALLPYPVTNGADSKVRVVCVSCMYTWHRSTCLCTVFSTVPLGLTARCALHVLHNATHMSHGVVFLSVQSAVLPLRRAVVCASDRKFQTCWVGFQLIHGRTEAIDVDHCITHHDAPQL